MNAICLRKKQGACQTMCKTRSDSKIVDATDLLLFVSTTWNDVTPIEDDDDDDDSLFAKGKVANDDNDGQVILSFTQQ